MEARLLCSGTEKTYVLIFDTGDEVMQILEEFARRNGLGGSHFTAIGAFQDATLGYFEWDRKKYKPIPIHEQVEVVSLIGDIALDQKGAPKVHAHVVLGKSDGTAWGGHLLEAHVRPTLELTLIESPGHLQRKYDPAAGIALINLDVSEGVPA
ncbi:MAG TPA: PPC domain-containing DNA-binding protein [Chthonomonadaceae bacterium]|nr:PPC domain-containing DNA-binding protein [Chthonomonadaceae bacterium]